MSAKMREKGRRQIESASELMHRQNHGDFEAEDEQRNNVHLQTCCVRITALAVPALESFRARVRVQVYVYFVERQNR